MLLHLLIFNQGEGWEIVGYQNFRSEQLQFIRQKITIALENSSFSSFHDLLKYQEFHKGLLNDPSWNPISRKALYSTIQVDCNPKLDTILKVCYLLDICLEDLINIEGR